MRRRSSASAVALARGVQVEHTEAVEARSRPRRCDIISATISGGTSAKSAPEPHDALHLDVFRLESRLPATSESTMKATKNTRLCVRVQLFEKWMYSQA